MKRSITIDILNKTVIQLLRDLEKLKFIRVHKENEPSAKVAPSERLSKKYAGKLPSNVAEEFQDYVGKSRDECNRRSS